jgi:hypothetical protein
MIEVYEPTQWPAHEHDCALLIFVFSVNMAQMIGIGK